MDYAKISCVAQLLAYTVFFIFMRILRFGVLSHPLYSCRFRVSSRSISNPLEYRNNRRSLTAEVGGILTF